jgi:hypothetical protein
MVSVESARLGYFDRLFHATEENIQVELDSLFEECGDDLQKLDSVSKILSWTLSALSDKNISNAQEAYKNVERRNFIFKSHTEMLRKIRHLQKI